jgi:hypothetical protein
MYSKVSSQTSGLGPDPTNYFFEMFSQSVAEQAASSINFTNGFLNNKAEL